MGLGFFGIGIFWDFLGFLNFQIGIGFFWDWDFLGFFGFFGFSLYFLNLKLVLVFFCFLTIIYGNIHNRENLICYILHSAEARQGMQP